MDCLLIEEVLGNDRLDYVLFQIATQLIQSDLRTVLGADYDRMHADRNAGSLVKPILDRHLNNNNMLTDVRN